MSTIDVSLKRSHCLKLIFDKARKGTRYYERVEKRASTVAEAVCSSLGRLVTHYDRRFTSFQILQESCSNFHVYSSITLGPQNSSIYIQKDGQQAVLLQAEAETKKIWKATLTKTPHGENYLNAAKVQLALHTALREATRSLLSGSEWEKTRAKFGLKRLQLDPVCKLTIYSFSRKPKVGSATTKLTLEWTSHLDAPPYAECWLHRMYGDNVPAFIARSLVGAPTDPELIWSLSYHKHEARFLKSAAFKPWLEALHTAQVFMRNDDVLQSVHPRISLHIFLQTFEHFSSWFQLNYEPGRSLTQEHVNNILEFFLKSLLDCVGANFVSNFFNPEFNLLSAEFWSQSRRQAVLNKIKVLLRGGCECCRERIRTKLLLLQAKKNGSLRSILRSPHVSEEKNTNATRY